MLSPNTPDLGADEQVIALQPVAENIRKFAGGLVIRSPADYSRAADTLKSIKGALAQIEDARTRITKPLNETLREVNEQARNASSPFKADETVIKTAMIRFSDEQDRLREEEQRKANEVAAKERWRLQEQAEEAQRKADAEAQAKRKAADEAAAAGRAAEAARLNAQAAKVEEKALDKVDQLQSRAASVVAPISQQAAPKIAGVSVPMVWDFELENEALVPREFCDVNQGRIRKVVQAMQGNTRIPGVRVLQRKRISAGTN